MTKIIIKYPAARGVCSLFCEQQYGGLRDIKYENNFKTKKI